MTKKYAVLKAIGLSFCLVTALTLFFSPTSVKAQAYTSTSSYTQQVFPSTFSPCAGGSITLTGEMHFVFHVTETPSGQRVFRSHINYQGVSGFDSAGNEYQLASQSNDTSTYDEELRTATVVQYYKLIGHGAAANERVRNINHVTFNDNGEITSIFSKFDADCSN